MAINFQDPRLQRSKQKMAALGSDSKAIFNTAAATADFAEREAIKQLKLQSIGREVKSRKDSLAHRQAQFNAQEFARSIDLKDSNRRMVLAEDDLDFQKKTGRNAAILGGLSILPKTYLGYQQYKSSGQKASDVVQLAKEIQASYGG